MNSFRLRHAAPPLFALLPLLLLTLALPWAAFAQTQPNAPAAAARPPDAAASAPISLSARKV
ncbi:MAG: hypothetical protein ABI781_15080, partial [Burkholderiales bacterium]